MRISLDRPFTDDDSGQLLARKKGPGKYFFPVRTERMETPCVTDTKPVKQTEPTPFLVLMQPSPAVNGTKPCQQMGPDPVDRWTRTLWVNGPKPCQQIEPIRRVVKLNPSVRKCHRILSVDGKTLAGKRNHICKEPGHMVSRCVASYLPASGGSAFPLFIPFRLIFPLLATAVFRHKGSQKKKKSVTQRARCTLCVPR